MYPRNIKCPNAKCKQTWTAENEEQHIKYRNRCPTCFVCPECKGPLELDDKKKCKACLKKRHCKKCKNRWTPSSEEEEVNCKTYCPSCTLSKTCQKCKQSFTANITNPHQKRCDECLQQGEQISREKKKHANNQRYARAEHGVVIFEDNVKKMWCKHCVCKRTMDQWDGPPFREDGTRRHCLPCIKKGRVSDKNQRQHKKIKVNDAYEGELSRTNDDGVFEKQCLDCGEWLQRTLLEKGSKRCTPCYEKTIPSTMIDDKPCRQCVSGRCKNWVPVESNFRTCERCRDARKSSRNREKANKGEEAYYNEKTDKAKAWHARNHEHRRASMKDKYQTDIGFKMKVILRGRLSVALKTQRGTKKDSACDLISCSIDDLIEHLQSQFKDGMTISNHGEWHIDHIVPCSSFDLTNEEEQRLCFHFLNLQPLWASENLKKSAKTSASDRVALEKRIRQYECSLQC